MSAIRDPDPSLAPAEPSDAESDARSTASQQFIHGVLSFVRCDTTARQHARVQRVMAALEPASAAHRLVVLMRPAGRRLWFRGGAVAAALALFAGVLYFTPGTPSATAMVERSLAAAASAGDRRYEVRLPRPEAGLRDGSDHKAAEPIGVIDVRSGDRMVVRARTPFGDRVAFGRDGSGAWAIRPDGVVDRLAAGNARPRWVDLGESTILLDSAESLLKALTAEYQARAIEAAPLPDDATVVCDRISAVRRDDAGPEPKRIEVWIDRQSRLARRIELHWPDYGPPRRGRDGGGPGPRPGDEGERFREPGPGRRPPPPGDRPARTGPGPDGPDGPEGNGPPPGERRPGMGPPPGEGFGGQRPMPPARGEPREQPGPDGRGDPREAGPRGPRPRFLDQPPDFRREHRPPPRTLVFQLVEAPAIGGDWFSPEAHLAWVSEVTGPNP